MIRLSVNNMSGILSMLERIVEYKILTLKELDASYKHNVMLDDYLSFAVDCGWISISEHDEILFQTRGSIILDAKKKYCDTVAFLYVIEDYIIFMKPAWKGRIPYGRYEAFFIMSKDEQACFYEANLMSEIPDKTIIEWWDRISESIRGELSINKTNVGRKGELNTLEYEKNRTGVQPKYEAFDTNLAGYDVLSQVDQNCTKPLLIEVKSTTKSIENASFFISKNEWETAVNSAFYKFYLWAFSDSEERLANLSVEEISDNMPIEQNEGHWTSVEIPYSCFKDKFRQI